MNRSTQRFAELLQEAIAAIAARTSKPKSVIHDELGYAIGRTGGSAIEYWVYGDGHIPRQQSDVEALARALVDAGELDQPWLRAFLESASFPDKAALIADLFPNHSVQMRDNLPVAPTPFLGRDAELANLARMIADPGCRLITLAGPGGSGKTRLATEVARNAHASFTDGAVFVPLAPLSSADLIVPTVADSLGLSLDDHSSVQAQVLRYMRQQALLLVLDNAEHLLPAAERPQPEPGDSPAISLVTAILDQAPDVKMLVTSRERLNIRGEWVYDVGGLSVPTEEASSSDEFSLEEYSAPTLFVQTARRAQANFAPTAADLAAILRICRIVDGMPLAIEMAAAWVRVLSCSEIEREIEEDLELLATTGRDLSPRHHSMRAVFDHSWELLSAEEQRVLARCSVFRGGFTREAAVDVAGASLSILAALVDKSLLRRNRQGRYVIHELARQYAADRLREAHDVVCAPEYHLRFFQQFAEEAELPMRCGSSIADWLERVEREHDNIRTALDWALSDGDFALGMCIVGALWQYWMDRGHALEGQKYAERFLARSGTGISTYQRARALHTAGVLAYYQGQLDAAYAHLVEGIALGRRLETEGKSFLALALLAYGHVLISIGDLDAAETTAKESLGLGRELNDILPQGHATLQMAMINRIRGDTTNAERNILASIEFFEKCGNNGMWGGALTVYSQMLRDRGDNKAARAYASRALTITEMVGDAIRTGFVLRQLGSIAAAQGDYIGAEADLTRALELLRRVGQTRQLMQALEEMGRLATWQENYSRALVMLRESLSLSCELNNPPLTARALDALACLAARQGEMDAAARLWGSANAQATSTDMILDPVLSVDPRRIEEHEHWVSVARTQLGEAAFTAAWATGSTMTTAEILDYAAGYR